MSTSSNLTVLVSATTAGRYHCKATAAGFGEVNAEVTVSVKGAPVIDSPVVQYGSPTDTVRLECMATSVPVAEKIVWTYHGTVIGTQTDQSYYSVSTPTPVPLGLQFHFKKKIFFKVLFLYLFYKYHFFI